MNELADANQTLFAQPPDNWRRPTGRPPSTWIRNVCNDMSSFGTELPEDMEAAQNRPFWLMLKAKFHHAIQLAIWFEAGSNQLASWIA